MSILLRFYIVGRGEEGGKGELPNLMNLFRGERALLELVVCLYWVHVLSRIPLYWCVPLCTNCHNIFPSIVDRQLSTPSLWQAQAQLHSSPSGRHSYTLLHLGGTAALFSIWRAQLHFSPSGGHTCTTLCTRFQTMLSVARSRDGEFPSSAKKLN